MEVKIVKMQEPSVVVADLTLPVPAPIVPPGDGAEIVATLPIEGVATLAGEM